MSRRLSKEELEKVSEKIKRDSSDHSRNLSDLRDTLSARIRCGAGKRITTPLANLLTGIKVPA